jgi:hypothetical protein
MIYRLLMAAVVLAKSNGYTFTMNHLDRAIKHVLRQDMELRYHFASVSAMTRFTEMFHTTEAEILFDLRQPYNDLAEDIRAQMLRQLDADTQLGGLDSCEIEYLCAVYDWTVTPAKKRGPHPAKRFLALVDKGLLLSEWCVKVAGLFTKTYPHKKDAKK